MSASTGTIQRPMAGGSILGAVAIGVATLFAVGALAWGAANLTATKNVAAPVAAPTYLDRGGRELAAPIVGKAATPFDINSAHAVPWVERNTVIVGKPGNVTPQFPISVADPWQLGANGYLSAAAAAARSEHAAPLLDRNAENVVVQQAGPGKHAE